MLDRSRLRRRLLDWFDANARDLPWRHTRDPYRVWISEVMLQQTTVAAVIPHFHRFLAAFPTLADLAAAPSHDVLKLWQGLGYYSRARNLHRAAQIVVADHSGELPRDPAALRALPGFGRYTAHAVLSQAFDLKLPILETNSARVLCRLFAIAEDPKAPGVVRQLWERSEELLPAHRVGDFNQAMMELGALVCTPTEPRCEVCPLTSLCQARREGLTGEIPRKTPRAAPTEVHEVAVILWNENQVLLAQRPETGRWAQMWEFPRVELAAGQSHSAAAEELIRGLGFEAVIDREIGSFKHGVTRFRIALVGLEGRVITGRFVPGVYPHSRWIAPSQFDEFPLSTPQRRLAKIVMMNREG